MKKLLTYITLLFLTFCSCTKEKDYYLIPIQNEKVNFTAVNLTVGMDAIDSAESLLYRGDFSNWEYREKEVTFTLPYAHVESPDEEFSETIHLDRVNQLWIGGNNHIQFKFLPSCPEEKSATFTLPDGTSHVLTATDDTFVWYFDEEACKKSFSYTNYNWRMPVYAISEYEKDGIKHVNCGFLHLYNDTFSYYYSLYYDPSLNRWLMGPWPNN